jgi:hypothetical protein
MAKKGKNKMKYLALIACCCFALLSGCATEPSAPLTIQDSQQTLPPAPANKAQIVFIKPFKPLGGSHLTPLFENQGPQKELLTLIPSEGKFVKHVSPGRHVFSTDGHFMQANVEAGKRYYVLVRFIAYNGYQLRPIRRTGPSDYNASIPEFQKWLKDTHLASMTAEGREWYMKNKALFDRSQLYGQEVWQKKTAEQRAELTLNGDDDVMQ